MRQWVSFIGVHCLEPMSTPTLPFPFANWQLQEQWAQSLPMDANTSPKPRPVDSMGAFVQPTPVATPQLLAASAKLCQSLQFDPRVLADPVFAPVLTGNTTFKGFRSYATNYGGHQFGNWAGQLGDGRAIVIAELRNAKGERQELQLKGAGLTPFSRFADGRAVLRSSVREYIASEAMHALGVPTSRALWLASTGDSVVRDRYYDGHPEPEPGAVVCRVAPSWIRFGHFELPAARGDTTLVRQLADFCIAKDFPHLQSHRDENRYGDWFREICERTARMIAHWQAVGFVHGVMNTDNMSVLGLTIDYGPFGFMDRFDSQWTPNTTDHAQRRYRYAQQPAVGFWNLQRLAMALGSLFPDPEPLREGLMHYQHLFVAEDLRMQSAKLGLTSYPKDVVQGFAELLQAQALDFRLAYLALQFNGDLAETSYLERPDQAAINLWLADYRVARASHAAPFAHNSRLLPHNWLLQELIESTEQAAAQSRQASDLQLFLQAMDTPTTTRYPSHWGQMRPDWASERRGCTDLSCSS